METKNSRTNKHEKGFTIIELMISTIIFSLVLLGATAAILQIGKQYYKGITQANTQEVTRSTVEEIAQSLQYTKRDIRVPNYPDIDNDGYPDAMYYEPLTSSAPAFGDEFYFCIGSVRYSFVIGASLGVETEHALWVDEPDAGCANAVTMGPAELALPNPSSGGSYPGSNGRELLSKFMQITELSIIPRQNQLWTISMSIATGDTDNQVLVQTVDASGNPTGDTRVTCEGEILGSEFCAISEISVNVSKRIQ